MFAPDFSVTKRLLSEFLDGNNPSFFESGGFVSCQSCNQASGNSVKVGDGCATVMATIPNATVRKNGKAGKGLMPESGYRFDCARQPPNLSGHFSAKRRMKPVCRFVFGGTRRMPSFPFCGIEGVFAFGPGFRGSFHPLGRVRVRLRTAPLQFRAGLPTEKLSARTKLKDQQNENSFAGVGQLSCLPPFWGGRSSLHRWFAMSPVRRKLIRDESDRRQSVPVVRQPKRMPA
jgi:hypothetical protein